MDSTAVHFGWLNWLVLAAFFLGTSWVAHHFRGTTSGLRGFFLGNRSLPWWAVTGSIVATQVSALTFIAVPAFVFRPGGNLTYMQMILGMVTGKLLMAAIFVKPYYEEEIYSPYDYMARRLDPRVGQLGVLLFTVGAVLSQGVRLLATALVLSVITGFSLLTCTLLIVSFSVLWTLLGGITTVIWTDVVQFLVFTVGGLVALAWAVGGVSLGESLAVLDQQAKLTILDLSLDPTKTFTLWVGLVGFPLFELGMTSIDQVVAQRIMCCRNAKEAQRAVRMAAWGVFPTFITLAVGLGLVVFYSQNPLQGSAAQQIAAEPDRIFPYFLATQMPPGISGLIIAAIFAAGISTLGSALAALSQTSVMGIYARYLKKEAGATHYLLASRFAIVFWGLVLSILAMTFHIVSNEGLLELGFAAPGYVYGTLLGIAFLALLGRGDWRAILIGSILSVGTVLWLQAANVSMFWWYPAACIVLMLTALALSSQKANPLPLDQSESLTPSARGK